MDQKVREMITFIHHSLWALKTEVNDAGLKTSLEQMRKTIEPHIPAGENAYCSNVAPGGAKLLALSIT